MTKELTDLQEKTLGVIKGCLTKVTGKEIAMMIGLKPRSSGKEGADMRQIIHALRVKGYPICASTEGYWWPKSKEEVKGYIDSFQARVDDQQAAVDGMREGARVFGVGEWESGRYMVEENGERKVYVVAGDRITAFKEKFPDAKRV